MCEKQHVERDLAQREAHVYRGALVVRVSDTLQRAREPVEAPTEFLLRALAVQRYVLP